MQWKSAVFNNGNARQPPELMHYGILGQKWGLRRFQNEDRSLTPAGKERYGRGSENSKGKTGGLKKKKLSKEEAMKREEGKDRSKWKDKDVSKLSDEELRRRNNRLNAERNYKENITPQWKKWGKDALKAILITSAVAIVAESFKETLKPHVKTKMENLYKDASSKTISSLNEARRKSAPARASLIMQNEILKDRFRKKG